MHTVPSNPGLMIITNVDKKKKSIMLSRQKCQCSYRDYNIAKIALESSPARMGTTQ